MFSKILEIYSLSSECHWRTGGVTCLYQDSNAPDLWSIVHAAKSFCKYPIAALALICVCTTCQAIDSVSIEFANGNRTRMIRAGLQRGWDRRWMAFDRMYIDGYWDFTLAYWCGNRYRGIPDSTQQMRDIGITPVFRLERDGRTGPYGEAGLGVHMLSAHYDNNGHKLSTNLQFGTHFGVGYVVRNGVDVGLKIEHFSNAGIKEPNSGVNFVVLRAAYTF